MNVLRRSRSTRRAAPSGLALGRALGRCVYEAQIVVAQHPALAFPVARLRGHGVLVGPDTEVVIEGFPRSANSFAVAAFAMAQRPRETRIAHHVHAPAQVIRAARLGTPALVLIREPEDAVLEYVIKKPTITIGQALRGYARFYGPLTGYRSEFVVGVFRDVIADFGAVMRRVNDRFGTRFRAFEHTEEHAAAALDELDRWWRNQLGPGEGLEITVGRPSALRDRLKDALRDRYRDPRLAVLRGAAERLYRRFAQDVGPG